MSIVAILREETKNQAWSKIYANRVNTKLLTADNISSPGITFSLVDPDVVYTVVTSQGILNDDSTVYTEWQTTDGLHPSFMRLEGALHYNTVGLIPSTTTSPKTFTVRVTLPFSIALDYPGADNSPMPGTSSIMLIDTNTNAQVVGSTRMEIVSNTQFDIFCFLATSATDQSTPVLSRNVYIGYSVVGRIASGGHFAV